MVTRINRLEEKIDKLCSEISLLNAKVDKTNSNQHKNDKICYQLAKTVNSIIGLKEIAASENTILKYFWAFLLCTGIGATAFFIYQTGEEYFGYPTATNIELINHVHYKFPPIVLCPPPCMDVRKVKTTNLSMDAIWYSLGYFDNAGSTKIQNLTKAKENFENYYRTQNFTSLPDYFISLGSDFSITNSEIEFAHSLVPTIYCSHCAPSKPFEKFFMTDNVCGIISLANISSGLGNPTPTIFAKTFDKTSNIFETDISTWYVYIPRHFEYPESWFFYLTLEPDKYSLLKVTERKIHAINKISSPCKDKSGNYSQYACLVDCENRFYKNKFGCITWINTKNNENLNQYCNYNDAYENSTFSYFNKQTEFRKFQEQVATDCFRECPYKCHRKSYEFSLVSQMDVNEMNYEDIAKSARTQNMSLTIMGILHSAPSDGGIFAYNQVPTYSPIQLLNNIGGTLGLFVGGTLMTLVQVIVFCIRNFMTRWQMFRNS